MLGTRITKNSHNRPQFPRGIPGNERINAFSDGVFAIVITLLVLELHAPQVPPAQLTHALIKLIPTFIGHVVSFVVLGIYWVAHHNAFLHIRRHDRTLLWLNNLFLMCVASMPFPTSLMVLYSDQEIALVIYAATLAVAGISLEIMWWYASHDHRLVNETISPELVRYFHRRILIAPTCYLSVIPISFINLTVAKLIVAAVALFFVLPNPLDHYHHAQFDQHDHAHHEHVQLNQHETKTIAE